ncbi:MAG: SAM domain-containing protein [Xanthobacteraceae bacterium]
MQQIADWLEKLGLSECADRFAENRIDFSVLRDLTDQDLTRFSRKPLRGTPRKRSGPKKNSNCCCGVGPRQRPAKAK